MPKRAGKHVLPTLERSRRSIAAIRSRPGYAEEASESHAREWFARAVSIPFARGVWGKRLKAVVMMGSVQMGVRKATTRRPKSDLDILFIVDGPSGIPAQIGEDTLLEPLRERAKKLGFTLDADVRLPHEFSRSEAHFSSPFHILHGRAFLESLMGPARMAKIAKRKMPHKKKYE